MSPAGSQPGLLPPIDFLLAVAAGGALGATARVIVAWWGRDPLHPAAFPWWTLTVNVAGSLLLGLVLGSEASGRLALASRWAPFWTAGVCGALTTFSTFSFETVALWSAGARGLAAVNLLANLALCLPAAAAGFRWASRL